MLVTRLVDTEVRVSREWGSEVVLKTTFVDVATGVYTPVTVLDATMMRELLEVALSLEVSHVPSVWVQVDCWPTAMATRPSANVRYLVYILGEIKELERMDVRFGLIGQIELEAGWL